MQIQSIDHSICADVKLLTHQFEDENNNRICLIFEHLNLTDSDTKPASALIPIVQFLILTVTL